MAESPEEQIPMQNVTQISDFDVLCGRGGAALRHPGNQTYRRLVQLNKGLYITCLKTEKLKISRSIVAAIREQKGRFLEKDAKTNTYYDIGDKKAVEKTSQALREGQPKLRQQIAEMQSQSTAPGGAGPGLMERQYGFRGMAQEQPMGMNMNGNLENVHPTGMPMEPPQMMPNHMGARQQDMHPMLPPTNVNGGMASSQVDAQADLLGRLSISDLSGQQISTMSMGQQSGASILSHPSMQRARYMKPSLNQRGSVAQELGMESNLSLMSEFSSFNGSTFMTSGNGLSAHQSNFQDQQSMPAPDMANGGEMPGTGARSRRASNPRALFASMKYTRPASSNPSKMGGSSHHTISSINDGMPDIHMVESNLSLFSNLSNMTDHKDSTHRSADSTHSRRMDMDGLGPGSRHSVMSGLSRISDTSYNDASIFSDLSRKIGNVSTRSIAMSETSLFDIKSTDEDGAFSQAAIDRIAAAEEQLKL